MTCGFLASSIFSTSHSHFRLRSTRTDVVTGIYISVGLLSTEVYSPISEGYTVSNTRNEVSTERHARQRTMGRIRWS